MSQLAQVGVASAAIPISNGIHTMQRLFAHVPNERTPCERISVNSLFMIVLSLTTLVATWLTADSCTAQDAGPHDVVIEQSPESVDMSTPRLSRLDRNLEGYVERGEVAGVVALIARRGKVVYHRSFSQRHVEAQTAMTRDTIFRIASMTKPIVSVALMQLWEQGHFQLRDPISRFLPEFAEMKVAVTPADGERLGQPYKLVEAARPITFQHNTYFLTPPAWPTLIGD